RPGIRPPPRSARRAARSAGRRSRRRAAPCRRDRACRTSPRAPPPPPRSRPAPASRPRSPISLARDRFAPPQHLRRIVVAVQVEFVDAAEAVVDAALLERGGAHHLARHVLARGRRRGFMARAERHPVLGAGLAAPERAERGDTGALAVRDPYLAALRAIRIMAAHAHPVAGVGAGDGRLILVDLAVAVVVET